MPEVDEEPPGGTGVEDNRAPATGFLKDLYLNASAPKTPETLGELMGRPGLEPGRDGL